MVTDVRTKTEVRRTDVPAAHLLTAETLTDAQEMMTDVEVTTEDLMTDVPTTDARDLMTEDQATDLHLTDLTNVPKEDTKYLILNCVNKSIF